MKFTYEDILTAKNEISQQKTPQILKHFYTSTRALFKRYLEENIDIDQLLLLADNDFCFMQMFEIHQGILEGLTNEQISLYADLKFHGDQMYVIRESFKLNLTNEQRNFLANNKFNADQMYKIFLGFKNCTMNKKK